MSTSAVHFAGPDVAPGRLRDLLAERVAAVPAGGSIEWVTYYFRDRRLARDLVDARRRGVAVGLTLDGRPRTPHANRAVLEILGDGLGAGLRVVRGARDASVVGRVLRARLHEKLYCFSHPEPLALIGSFNPSGDEPEEDPSVIREIGDQDRGYNLLVEVRDAPLVGQLVTHAERLRAGSRLPDLLARFAPDAQRALRGRDLEIHFTPRMRPPPLLELLRAVGSGARVRIVASHLSGQPALRALFALVSRGARVEVLSDATLRRLPQQVERRLRSAGIRIDRVSDPTGLPMHDKFALLEEPAGRTLAFGSLNWTTRSLRYNREISVISRSSGLWEAFAGRWDQLRAAADRV